MHSLASVAFPSSSPVWHLRPPGMLLPAPPMGSAILFGLQESGSGTDLEAGPQNGSL